MRRCAATLPEGVAASRRGEPGPWHALPQGIEGYEHEPGIRNVVRVQRYRPAPAGASSAVYVLDMVVESQRPPR